MPQDDIDFPIHFRSHFPNLAFDFVHFSMHLLECLSDVAASDALQSGSPDHEGATRQESSYFLAALEYFRF
jgi:hypothetical protein